MASGCVWTAAVGLFLGLSLIDPHEAATPFQVTFLPAHVVKHFTQDVTVRCSHKFGSAVSQLQEISRIRMLKKSSLGWQLLAELQDNEDAPKTFIDVSVSARVNSNIRDSFLEIVWPVATQDTFGTYRCDVVGFDKKNFLNTVEVTSELALVEEDVTTGDMMKMFRETKDEMQHIQEDTMHVEGDVKDLDGKLAKLSDHVSLQNGKLSRMAGGLDAARRDVGSATGDVTGLKGDVSSLKTTMDTAEENRRKLDHLSRGIDSVETALASDSKLKDLGVLVSWPAGQFALLQPATGCPVDLTFFGGDEKYWQIHTESSSGFPNQNNHSDFLPPQTLSAVNGDNFLTLRFCEANGVLNTGPWPQGSYCVNRISGVPCPFGSYGEIGVYPELDNPVEEFTSRSVDQNRRRFLFCCGDSGHPSTPTIFPDRSPFILYRLGGVCQRVAGMSVTEGIVTIDTDDGTRRRSHVGTTPDERFDDITMVHIELCYYTPL